MAFAPRHAAAALNGKAVSAKPGIEASSRRLELAAGLQLNLGDTLRVEIA